MSVLVVQSKLEDRKLHHVSALPLGSKDVALRFLDEVRNLWQAWKQAWGTGDSEEAIALMEMDLLLGVDDQGNVV